MRQLHTLGILAAAAYKKSRKIANNHKKIVTFLIHQETDLGEIWKKNKKHSPRQKKLLVSYKTYCVYITKKIFRNVYSYFGPPCLVLFVALMHFFKFFADKLYGFWSSLYGTES